MTKKQEKQLLNDVQKTRQELEDLKNKQPQIIVIPQIPIPQIQYIPVAPPIVHWSIGFYSSQIAGTYHQDLQRALGIPHELEKFY